MAYRPHPDLVDYLCRNCLSVVGQCNAHVLVFETVTIRRMVEFTCRECAHKQKWRPDENAVKVKTTCTTPTPRVGS